ncbi:MAG: restriction endonuclease subunit S [Pontibacterium sp.]
MSWPLVKVGELGVIFAGGTPSRSNQSYWGKGISWLSIRDYKDFDYVVSTREQITEEGLNNSSAKIFEKGSVIISIFATLGRVAILGESMATNQAIAGIRCNDDVNNQYLMYCLKSKLSEIEKKSGGVAQKNINLAILKSLQIPLPPLETQKQIAAVLEKADQLRKDCQRMEQELNNLAQSVFIDMFGDSVTNPKGWDVHNIGDIASVQLGKMLSEKSKQGTNPKKYLRNANVQWRFIKLDDLLEMDFIEKEMIKFELIDGDLLVCEGGEIGRCAIWKSQIADCFYQKALHRVRLNPEICTPEYMQEYFFWMAKRGGLVSSSNEVTFKHLTAEKMNKLSVPIPPIELQRKYSGCYEAIYEKIANNNIIKNELGDHFNSLMQRAFKGELNLTPAQQVA